MNKENRYEKILKIIKANAKNLNINENKFPTPPEDKDELSNFARELYEDAKNFKTENFGVRKDIGDPDEFWKKCAQLEAGAHWEVWGRRSVDQKDKWKAELIDDEIANQIRVKVAYLSANFHDFNVLPNIKHIDEIVNQEFELTSWRTKVIDIIKKQCIYGTVFVKSFMDYSTDPYGVVNEEVIDLKNIFLSPYTKDLTKNGNCWYIIHATVVPKNILIKKFAESMNRLGVDPDEITETSTAAIGELIETSSYSGYGTYNTNFKKTELIDVMEIFLDDYTLIDNEFSEAETALELQAILQGVKPPVLAEQNHKKHIESHLKLLSEINSEIPTDGPEAQKLELINAALEMHIMEHLEFRLDGKIEKYPYGRKIVLAGNKIIEDIPNPYNIDWRKLFHICHYETSQGSIFGRGMVETMWNTNLAEDLLLSRLADIGLLGIPKPWLNEESRPLIERDGFELDPTKVGFYVGAPPQFPQTRTPMEFLHGYKILKDIAQKNYGISAVTYGETPSAQASGDLVEILLRQNSIVVTGEASQHLNELIKSVIETKLQLMKKFYYREKLYFIDGRYVPIVVSDILSYQPVIDESGNVVRDANGNILKEPIPKLEVKIKANSNLPNQWELDFSIFTRLLSIQTPDGTPLIPIDALYDVLSVRYPQFAIGGKYRQMNQIMQLGMQTLRQLQEQQMQKAKQQEELQSVVKSVQRSKLRKQIESETEQQETEEQNTGEMQL